MKKLIVAVAAVILSATAAAAATMTYTYPAEQASELPSTGGPSGGPNQS